MQHLLAAWGEVAPRLRAARRVLLFSDYDGTLTPIVERPEQADLSLGARRLLQALAGQRRFTVGVISGRALSDLRLRVGIRGIIYAGNHGLEIEGPGLSFVNPLAEEVRPLFRLLHRVLSRALDRIPGVQVEDKGLTLSVHYRQVEDGEADEVKGIFERVVTTARSLGKLRTTSGKKVYEVRPAVAWDKGKAISLLLDRYGKSKGGIPVFLGDDLTDEDGFKVIEKVGGISIFVGEENRESVAPYFLRTPGEVEDFLGRLLERVSGHSP